MRYDASNRYGNYGVLILNADSGWTASARRFMLTSGLDVNKFAIIRSVDATTDPSFGDGGVISSGTADFVINSNGLVGIGITSPTEKLHVNGDTRIVGNTYVGGIINAYQGDASIWVPNLGQAFTVKQTTGNVGIGTTSPSQKLEVGSFLDAVTNRITVAARYEYEPEFNFRLGQSGTNLDWVGAVISSGDDGNYNGKILFKTANAGRDTPTTKMAIKANGNVGIGTTSPSENLHVLGRGIFDGGSGNSSTDAVLYVTKSNNNDWGLYVNNVGLDYGIYARMSPSAEYAIAIHNGTTWTTRITGNAIIYLGEKNAIEGNYDSWLRLNNSNHYASGVYTPGVMRADGGFQVSGNTVIHSGTIGSQSVSYANSAGSAGYVTSQSGQLASYDNRIISPSETNASYLQFGFTSWANNNSAPYADYLHLRSYPDSSGGSDNLVMFLKSGIGMRIYQQTFGSASAYSSYADVWHTGNLTNLNQLSNGPGYITSYSETDTLASVTGRGASTSTNITLSGTGNQFNGHHYFLAYDANGNHYPHYNAGSNANGSKLNLRMFDSSGNAVVFFLNGNDKSIQWNGYTIYHAGNIPTWNQNTTGSAGSLSSMNISQFTNNSGYITGYTETDTLASVTGRGASTSTNITVGPDLTVQADGSVGYTASRLWLNSHNNYRGAGVHMSGVGSTWFAGTPYTDFDGGYVISRTGTSNDQSSAQYSNALLTVKSSGNVGIGTSSPAYKLDISGNSRTTGIHYVDTYLVTPYIYGGGPITMGNDVTITSATAWNASAARLNVGGTGDGRIQVRHIYGKSSASAAADHLWLQYQNTGSHVQIGDSGGGNHLYVSGNIYMGGYFSGNLVATQSWVSSQNYLTSYSETDTLASVTGRGASTSTAVTFSGGATITGLTIAKSAGVSTITFPAGSNDPAFISHTESTANNAIMRFSVGDDNDTNDYFAFGNTGNPDAFRINANGTISTGTWQGTAIADAYISSAATWNTAYGWGNHASAGYLTSLPSHNHDDRYFTETESDARYPLYRGTLGTTTNVGDATGFGNNLASGTYTRNYVGHSGQVWMSHDTGGSVGNFALEVTYYGAMYVHTNVDSSSWVTKQIWTSDTFANNSSNWNTAYSWGNHASQSYATTSYVTTQINNLIAGAPGALDTLDELAAALGDDSSFATTVTNSIAGKVSKAGDTITTSNNYGLIINHTPALGDFVDALVLRSTTSGQRAQLGFATVDSDGDHHRASIRAYKGTQAFEGVFGIALRQPSAAHIQRLTLDYLGNLTIGGALTESSSIKLKENVETSEGNLEKVVNLRPVTYNKIGSQTKELGLIAEEVAEVYPEFVQYDESGEPVGVNYSRLTAALIGAVKELTQRIETLENNG